MRKGTSLQMLGQRQLLLEWSQKVADYCTPSGPIKVGGVCKGSSIIT